MSEFEHKPDDLLDRAAKALSQSPIPREPSPEEAAELWRMLAAKQSQRSSERLAEGIVEKDGEVLIDEAAARQRPIVIASTEPITIVLRAPPRTQQSMRIGPLSYAIAALLMCIAVTAAWQYKMSNDPASIVPKATDRMAADSEEMKTRRIGSVTEMVGCRLAAQPNEQQETGASAASQGALSLSSPVFPGRVIELQAGLLEVTFTTGAKVLLQGPAKFETDVNGGLLTLGKLTGIFEKKARRPGLPSQMPHGATPFAIRTPTAVVTDLSTEFGVEVDEQGYTTSHVFRGSIQLRLISQRSEQDCLTLNENEGARVEADRNQTPAIRRANVDAGRFVRRAHSDRIRIKTFSTGVNVNADEADPHWQVVAVDAKADVPPQPAVVIASLRPTWPANIAGRAKWISKSNNWYLTEPAGAAYVFRTAFDLKDCTPETAVVVARYIAVSNLRAVRLNGQNMPIPDENRRKHDGEQNQTYKVVIDRGFVEGTNVLEFEIESGDPPMPPYEFSSFGLRVDLEGSVQYRP
jgi:hypothetical protein